MAALFADVRLIHRLSEGQQGAAGGKDIRRLRQSALFEGGIVAAERVYGGTLLWSSVKGTLADYSSGETPRFRRVREGGYELAR